VPLLTRIFNAIYNTPELLNNFPELIRFRPVAVPKAPKNGIDQGHRLISVPEVPLKIFHMILKGKLN